MDADQMIKYLRYAVWRAHKEGEWTKEETFGFVGRLTELKHHLEEEIYEAKSHRKKTLESIARLDKKNQKNEAPDQELDELAEEVKKHLKSYCEKLIEKVGRHPFVSFSLKVILITFIKDEVDKIFAKKTSTKP